MDENTIQVDVQRLRLKPGDRVVLTLTQHCTEEEIQRVRERAQELFTGHEVIVLQGMTLQIVEGQEGEA